MRRSMRMAMVGALAVAQGACGGAARRETVAVAPPPPAPDSAAAAPMASNLDIYICVVQDGQLRLVRATYHPVRQDTTIDGRPFSSLYSDTEGYAGATEWFVNNEVITVHGRRHVKYGIPRHLGHRELEPAGEYRGVPLFVQAGQPPTSEIKYAPVSPGCLFQPYDGHANVGAVRG